MFHLHLSRRLFRQSILRRRDVLLPVVVVPLIVVAVGFLFVRRHAQRRMIAVPARFDARRAPGLPAHVRNPMNCGAAHPDGVWQFRAGESCCKTASRLNKRCLETPQALLLPLPACDLAACACRYQAKPDLRKNDRRTRMDRRDGIRMEVEKVDRRKGADRRKGNNAWRSGSY
jgi:hypothetical protein